MDIKEAISEYTYMVMNNQEGVGIGYCKTEAGRVVLYDVPGGIRSLVVERDGVQSLFIHHQDSIPYRLDIDLTDDERAAVHRLALPLMGEEAARQFVELIATPHHRPTPADSPSTLAQDARGAPEP